jgi:hypothetical protein
MSAKNYIFKVYRNIGSDNELDHVFTFIVKANSLKSAIEKFILNDEDGSILSLEFYTNDFEEKYPKIYLNENLQNLTKLIEEFDMHDLDPDNNEDDRENYTNFLRDNLRLITSVLMLLNEQNTNIFNITETNIIQ